MGVDMLGFRVIAGTEHFISPLLFQEIRGWIAGPRIVAEIQGLTDVASLAAIVESYRPDYFELSLQEYRSLHNHLTLPCLVSVSPADLPSLATVPHKSIAYFIPDSPDLPEHIGLDIPMLQKVDSKTAALHALDDPRISGVVLNGTPELRPGFKEYDTLADVLEQLDEY
jgi:phosphoribosylanthranilate isomerase